MAGQYLGARDFVRARHSVLMACGVATAIMVAAGIVFYVAAAPLAAFFLGGYESNVVCRLPPQLLHVVAFAMLPLAVMMVLVGALRGAGDTRWPLVLNLFGFVAGPRAAGDVLGLRHNSRSRCSATRSPAPAWASSAPGTPRSPTSVIRCVLLILRFRHDGWQRIDV